MNFNEILNNSVASLEQMLDQTNPNEIDDNLRMNLYSQILLIEYHNALSEELAKQGIII